MPTEVEPKFGNGATKDNVSIQLVANQSYKIVFYAQNSASQFSTYTDGAIKVDYTKATPNSNVDDAFYAVYDFVADGQVKNVTLTRPFAQLNIGTNDLGSTAVQAILSNINSTLEVTDGIYTDFNFLATGNALSGAATATYNLAAPEVNTDFPVAGYSNLCSVYLLSPQTKDLISASYQINNGTTNINTLNLSSTPAQMNYRTNVFGALLTTTNTFNITIDPIFEGSFAPLIWDGTKADPTIDEAAKTVTLTTPAQLAGFADLVNGGNYFAGYTVTLENDIDLAGLPWTPIGNGKAGSGCAFQGDFDGKGHTVSNLSITMNEDQPAAFFGQTDGAVKNLKFESPTVTGVHYTAVVVGYTRSDNLLVEGCTVNGATIVNNMVDNDNGDKVGAIVGFSNGTGSAVKNCAVYGTTITGVRDMGSIAGLMNGGISGCTASGVTLNRRGDYTAPTPYVGLLYGRRLAGTTNSRNIGAFDSANSINNVVINGYPEDGLVITNKSELQAFAKSVNTGGQTYAGKKVFLAADIDLDNTEWTPIGIMNESNSGTGNPNGPRFQGEFYGNGHIVKNFTINQPGNFAVAGFFGRVSGNVTISELGLFNFTITTNHYAGGVVAYIYNNGLNGTNVNIYNNSICNATITSTPNLQPDGSYDNGDKVGGVVGYGNVGKDGSIYISTNILSGMTIEAYRDLGGLIGYAENKNLQSSDNFGNFSGNGNVFNVGSGDIVLIQNLTKAYPVSGNIQDKVHDTYGTISIWKRNLFNATNYGQVKIQRIGE